MPATPQPFPTDVPSADLRRVHALMRTVGGVAVALVLLTGCAGSPADRGADARAERAGIVMERARDGSTLDMTRGVVGGDPTSYGTGPAIEVLVAEGDRFDGRIVLRITERYDDDGWFSGPSSVVRCYRYRYHYRTGDEGPHQIDCPLVSARSVPPAAPLPTVPAGLQSSLTDALRALPIERRTAANVERVAVALAKKAPVLDVATVGGVIGLAIGDGRQDCTAAMVTPHDVLVWHVPRVLAQPGELGCSADAAARGQGQHPPH